MKRGALERFKEFDLGDGITSVGLVAVFIGLHMYEPWTAYAVVGAVLTFFGLKLSGK